MVTQHSIEHPLLGEHVRSRTCDDLDLRIAVLFQRWPHRLSSEEARELRRLWDERVRLARHGSVLRARRSIQARRDPRRADGPTSQLEQKRRPDPALDHADGDGARIRLARPALRI